MATAFQHYFDGCECGDDGCGSVSCGNFFKTFICAKWIDLRLKSTLLRFSVSDSDCPSVCSEGICVDCRTDSDCPLAETAVVSSELVCVMAHLEQWRVMVIHGVDIREIVVLYHPISSDSPGARLKMMDRCTSMKWMASIIK